MTPLDTRRQQLEQRRAELDSHMRRIEAELDSHSATRDWEDMATEREEDEVLESMGRADLQETRMIDAALRRIDAGEYGHCVKCGDVISEERLDLLPYTPFCRICAV